MLNTQGKYLNYLDKLNVALSETKIQSDLIEALREAIASTELLIPIIGAFSAGKSSLINTFLGQDVLPVGITPETELATELRYAEEDCIQAVTLEGQVVKYAIDEMRVIKERAAEYSYLRLFLCNESLKSLAPLILVDMPGFDSALANHQKAIANYISHGVHYIVLTSIEDGTITRSMERQLIDINEFGRDFSFVLSKTNLRVDVEVAEIADRVEEQIDLLMGESKTVNLVGFDGSKQLKDLLAQIDPESLFQKLWQDKLTHHHMEIIERVNVSLMTLRSSTESNEKAVAEMKVGLARIKQKRDKLLVDIEERYSNFSINRCIDEVGRKLSMALEELITAVMSTDSELFSRSMTGIIQNALIKTIKAQMSEISSQVISEFAYEIKDINLLMSSYTSENDWLAKVTDNTRILLDKTDSAMESLSERLKTKGDQAKLFKIITTVLAVTTNIVLPVLELIIVFLPDLLSGFFEKKKRESVKNVILVEVIPSVKRELRDKLPELFQAQLTSLISQIGAEFEQSISEKQQSILLFEQEKLKDTTKITQEVEVLILLLQNLNVLARDFMSKESM